MIVDCHTHIWDSPEQLGRYVPPGADRPRGRRSWLEADPHRHLAASQPVDWTIVLGLRSHWLGANVPNEDIARYVRAHRDRVIGFAAVDPARPRESIREAIRAREELGLQGLCISPAAQDVHPASTSAMKVYAEAMRLRLPVVFDQDVLSTPGAKLEYARPYLLDEVAREFPDLKIVISHLGRPWVEETIALLGKHPNVYADVAGVLQSEWPAYNVLMAAYQADVMDKLLFGSNFPFASAASCIETLYSVNQVSHGTNLPTIPREQLRRIVERNALDLLGIQAPAGPRAAATESTEVRRSPASP